MTRPDDPRDPSALARDLLRWYDAAHRDLPWRVSPAARRAGAAPDPYHVWLSEVMLQQTTVATVKPYFADFVARWPSVEDLAAAPRDDVLSAWAGLGYYARARNLHACARVVAGAHGGAFPRDEAALLKLPGVGAYTAAAIAAIAFDRKATVVDGNVERVTARLFRIETPLPDAKPEIRARAAELAPEARPGDYAQALMDLGATVCTPRAPDCPRCPWASACAARAAGVAETLPRKRPKTPKPVRFGVAFVALDGEGRVLLERRPETGLLGGMTGLPGSDWTEAPVAPEAARAARPFPAAWRALEPEARHVFTHFHLRLGLVAARLTRAPAVAPPLFWRDRAAALDGALPTAMRKALTLALAELDKS